MDCQKAQEHILEIFESAKPTEVRRQIDVHLAGCAICADFAERQRILDAQLSAVLMPPELSPAFRTALRKRIRHETTCLWPDSLPDKVHFVSCGAATLLCVMLLPFDASAVLGAGAIATALTYGLLTAVRGSFENAEDPHQ